MYLISSCLLGMNCRIDFGHSFDWALIKLARKYSMVPICPERFAGIPLPAFPAEIVGGNGLNVIEHQAKVMEKRDDKLVDNSRAYVKGAEEVYKIASLLGILKVAILRSYSPSCGSGKTYSGEFNGSLRTGDGVTSAYLKMKGFTIYDQFNYPSAEKLEEDFKLWMDLKKGEKILC